MRGAARHVVLRVALLQADLLAPEQSSSPTRHGSCLVGDDMTHARDSFQATVALESWQQVCLLGPVSSPPGHGAGKEVLDFTEVGVPAARRPPRSLRTRGDKQLGLPVPKVNSKSLPTSYGGQAPCGVCSASPRPGDLLTVLISSSQPRGIGISLSFFEMRKIKFGKVKGLEIEVTRFLRRGSGIREDRASPSLSPRNLFPGSPSHQSRGGREGDGEEPSLAD